MSAKDAILGAIIGERMVTEARIGELPDIAYHMQLIMQNGIDEFPVILHKKQKNRMFSSHINPQLNMLIHNAEYARNPLATSRRQYEMVLRHEYSNNDALCRNVVCAVHQDWERMTLLNVAYTNYAPMCFAVSIMHSYIIRELLVNQTVDIGDICRKIADTRILDGSKQIFDDVYNKCSKWDAGMEDPVMFLNKHIPSEVDYNIVHSMYVIIIFTRYICHEYGNEYGRNRGNEHINEFDMSSGTLNVDDLLDEVKGVNGDRIAHCSIVGSILGALVPIDVSDLDKDLLATIDRYLQ
jgi:hypothetical protein